jgi:hypothetical protein
METAMPTRALAALITLSFLAAAHADPVADSVQRMLDHSATRAPVARPAEPADPLLAALIQPLRDGGGSAGARSAAVGDDPVRASFDRMLQHAPTALAARVPAGTDPLVAALIEPLRDGHGPDATRLLAQGAATTRR